MGKDHKYFLFRQFQTKRVTWFSLKVQNPYSEPFWHFLCIFRKKLIFSNNNRVLPNLNPYGSNFRRNIQETNDRLVKCVTGGQMDGQTRTQITSSQGRGLINQTHIFNCLNLPVHLISPRNTSSKSCNVWPGWASLTTPNWKLHPKKFLFIADYLHENCLRY